MHWQFFLYPIESTLALGVLIDNFLGGLLIYSGKAAASSSNELFGSFFSILKFIAYVTTFILTIAGMIIMAG